MSSNLTMRGRAASALKWTVAAIPAALLVAVLITLAYILAENASPRWIDKLLLIGYSGK